MTAEGATPVKFGERKDQFAHQPKVANQSRLVAEGSPARAGAQRSEREKGGDYAPGDSKGRSPWRAFGDFPRDGKVTRVQGGAPAGGCWDYRPAKAPGCRAERPLLGAGTTVPQKSPRVQGGAPAGRCWSYRPAKAPRGWRGGAPSRWVECRGGLMPSSQMGHAGPSPCTQIFSNSLRIDCIFCGEM